MPRYKEIYIKKEAKIFVWKIQETEDELIHLLGEYVIPARFEQYKSVVHRKQFLATQILLQQENLLDKMYKDENGKPILATGYLSISHDSDFVAVAVSEKICGIDLQSVSEKVLRIQHKFYDEADAPIFGDELSFFTLIWSIKEALYKIHGDPMVSFKECLRIDRIEANYAYCSILHPDYLGSFTLSITKVDDLFLVYTI